LGLGVVVLGFYDMEEVFFAMVKSHLNELRSNELPKGRFIGMYTQKLNSIDKDNAFRFKRPQFIGDKLDAKNNWLDHIIDMPSDEFVEFENAIKN
jgi:hypothetical protein